MESIPSSLTRNSGPANFVTRKGAAVGLLRRCVLCGMAVRDRRGFRNKQAPQPTAPLGPLGFGYAEVHGYLDVDVRSRVTMARGLIWCS